MDHQFDVKTIIVKAYYRKTWNLSLAGDCVGTKENYGDSQTIHAQVSTAYF